jgi:ribosome-binding ATPase
VWIPSRDREIINLELVLSDLQNVEKRISAGGAGARTGEKEAVAELALLRKLHPLLAEGSRRAASPGGDEEARLLRTYNLSRQARDVRGQRRGA